MGSRGVSREGLGGLSQRWWWSRLCQRAWSGVRGVSSLLPAVGLAGTGVPFARGGVQEGSSGSLCSASLHVSALACPRHLPVRHAMASRIASLLLPVPSPRSPLRRAPVAALPSASLLPSSFLSSLSLCSLLSLSEASQLRQLGFVPAVTANAGRAELAGSAMASEEAWL